LLIQDWSADRDVSTLKFTAGPRRKSSKTPCENTSFDVLVHVQGTNPRYYHRNKWHFCSLSDALKCQGHVSPAESTVQIFTQFRIHALWWASYALLKGSYISKHIRWTCWLLY